MTVAAMTVKEILPDAADPRIILDMAITNTMQTFENSLETLSPKRWARFLSHFLPDIPYEDIRERIRTVRKYRGQLMRLRAKPQVEQRSEEWFAMRKTRLTASDLAQSINKGKFGSRDELLTKKIGELDPTAPPAPFNANLPPLVFGTMFEDMVMRSYQQRNGNIALHDFGLVPHPDIECFGASPDAISDLGIMIEAKSPYRRKIDGTIPEQYMLQIQGQLSTCGLRECDYVETEFDRVYDADTYLSAADAEAITDHGAIVEFSVKGQRVYEYSPPYLRPAEAVEWSKETMKARMLSDATAEFSRYHFWQLRVYHCKRVTFDEEGWAGLTVDIRAFWDDVTSRRLPAPKPKRPSTRPSKKAEKEASYDFLSDSEDDAA